ncbi:hypothetical protein SERLA73DRAFT_77429 [Serpula lacrymans var. lacrymans S7.3]|uniref:Uncharacterized protein n=2 Tax=Serpula lacrymans var. lacrymans TaxID=341189 RepID=F8QA89_SERL3|nr:uncharacterized protein SERLADRAFT_442306 [Serpula lacrymans var. lacrymans S7.9]EGN94679.1 hypothetical protein SERLA73DRAFT_77429 [Serpula lacrymans var. lacrymans S7.3]EGO20161.1 hypothetical protein SERLADRAFT_442306 [Serpula lacrymans var. lacrymans S7.9]
MGDLAAEPECLPRKTRLAGGQFFDISRNYMRRSRLGHPDLSHKIITPSEPYLKGIKKDFPHFSTGYSIPAELRPPNIGPTQIVPP